MIEYPNFFEAIINAGAILSGFTSTFLVFRIQRESNYYRQPALSFEDEEAKDIYIGLTHFTSSFLLAILATISSFLFGLIIPIFGLAGGIESILVTPPIVVAGLVSTVILLLGYFFNELIHYKILGNKLINDAKEWGNEIYLLIVTIIVTIAAGVISYYLVL